MVLARLAALGLVACASALALTPADRPFPPPPPVRDPVPLPPEEVRAAPAHDVIEIPAVVERLRRERLADLDDPALDEALRALTLPTHAAEVRALFLAADPFPRDRLVARLEAPLLVTRLAALEVLETRAGTDFGFDPWADTAARGAALMAWRAWAGNPEASPVAAVDDEALAGALNALVSDDAQRSARGYETLRRSGPAAAAAARTFAERNPGLSGAARDRLRQLRYALDLAATGGPEPDLTARQLAHGKLDERIQALSRLLGPDPALVAIVHEHLRDPEPLVREAAVDLVVRSGGSTETILAPFLASETSPNVVHAALKALGEAPMEGGAALLGRYVANPDETLAVAALTALGRTKSPPKPTETVLAALADPRWRVRAAALDAARAAEIPIPEETFARLLEDEDEFVRISAVQTAAKLRHRNVVRLLADRFTRDPALRPTIVQAFLSLNEALPAAVLKQLGDLPPEDLLQIVNAISDCDAASAPVLEQFAGHADADVRFAALRVIGAADPTEEGTAGLFQRVLERAGPDGVAAFLSAPMAHSYRLGNFIPSREESAFFAPEPGPLEAGALAGYRDLLRRHFVASGDDAARWGAALRLLALGDPAPVDFVRKQLSSLDEAGKLQLAQALAGRRTASTWPLFQALLRDPSAEVRRRVVDAMVEGNAEPKAAMFAFRELTAPGATLQPSDLVDGSFLNTLSEAAGTDGIFFKELRDTVGNAASTEGRRLVALAALTQGSPMLESRQLEELTRDDGPWLRRQAFHALAGEDVAVLARAARDPHEAVREVAAVRLRADDAPWMIRLEDRDAMTFFPNRDFSEDLPKEHRDLLVALTSDPNASVARAAYLALMSHGVEFDTAAFAQLLRSMPAAQQQTHEFSFVFRDKGRVATMPDSYAALAEFLPDYLREDLPDRLRAPSAGSVAAPRPSASPGAAGATSPPLPASSPAPSAAPAAQPEPLEVVYFQKPGCSHCAEVAGMLARVREAFPELTVREYNINKQDAMRLNESLSDRFEVPENLRLVAPAVFAAGGFLIKDDINEDRLGRLLIASRGVRAPLADDAALAAAGTAIEQRYESIQPAIIVAAGLLDGLNPCAFATIIFLISYLQVARRTPGQIARIGIAYIAGVFTAYFVLGLGLVEVVSRVMAFQVAALVLNVAMGLFAAVIGLISLRDGWLCLRGRMDEMTLQLSGDTKGRIHEVIRRTARDRNFVLLAFGVGAFISFLELACTGQVYAPTILYMLKNGRAEALGYLALYNAAFVLPLAAVMTAAFFGMRSEQLIAVLRRHAAGVKFALAVLFLGLGAALLLRSLP